MFLPRPVTRGGVQGVRTHTPAATKGPLGKKKNNNNEKKYDKINKYMHQKTVFPGSKFKISPALGRGIPPSQTLPRGGFRGGRLQRTPPPYWRRLMFEKKATFSGAKNTLPKLYVLVSRHKLLFSVISSEKQLDRSHKIPLSDARKSHDRPPKYQIFPGGGPPYPAAARPFGPRLIHFARLRRMAPPRQES